MTSTVHTTPSLPAVDQTAQNVQHIQQSPALFLLEGDVVYIRNLTAEEILSI